MIYSYDIEVSDHDALKAGVVAKRIDGSQHEHHRVVVEAHDEIEGSLIAAEMGCALWGMTTVVHLRV